MKNEERHKTIEFYKGLYQKLHPEDEISTLVKKKFNELAKQGMLEEFDKELARKNFEAMNLDRVFNSFDEFYQFTKQQHAKLEDKMPDWTKMIRQAGLFTVLKMK